MFKLHHIGIVVDNVEEAAERYMRSFEGYKAISQDIVESEHVKILLLSDGKDTIEFVEPLTHNSPIFEFLIKGGGLHHLCFAVKDIDNYLIRNKKMIKVIRGKHRGFFELNTAFFVQRQIMSGMVLIELVEI